MKDPTAHIQKCTLRINTHVQLKRGTGLDRDSAGSVVGFAPTKIVQRKPRPYLVLFDSGRVGWYGRKALKRLREKHDES